MYTCPSCRQKVAHDAKFCIGCGKQEPGKHSLESTYGFYFLIGIAAIWSMFESLFTWVGSLFS